MLLLIRGVLYSLLAFYFNKDIEKLMSTSEQDGKKSVNSFLQNLSMKMDKDSNDFISPLNNIGIMSSY